MLSMFTESMIIPLLDELSPRKILLVNPDEAQLLSLLDSTGEKIKIEVLSSQAEYDQKSVKKEYGSRVSFLKGTPENKLQSTGCPDAVLLNADPNYYSTYTLLQGIRQSATSSRKTFPLVFIPGTGWPFARRDSYPDPENIPEDFLHQNAKGGLLPGKDAVLETGGLFADSFHAIEHGSERNGVLTAMEDFCSESRSKLFSTSVTVCGGIGILIAETTLTKKKKLKSALQSLNTNPLLNLVTLLDGAIRELTVKNIELDSTYNSRLESSISELEAVNEEHSLTIDELHEELKDSEFALDRKQEELEQIKLSLVSYQEQLQEAQDKLEEAETSLSETQEISIEEGSESEEIETIAGEYEEQLELLEGQNRELMDKLESMTAKLEELEQRELSSDKSRNDDQIEVVEDMTDIEDQDSESMGNLVQLRPGEEETMGLQAWENIQDEMILLKQTERELRADLAQARNDNSDLKDDFIKLQQWMSQTQHYIGEWRRSTSWKVGDALGSIYRKVMAVPEKPQACDELEKLFIQFSAWNQSFIADDVRPPRFNMKTISQLVPDEIEVKKKPEEKMKANGTTTK